MKIGILGLGYWGPNLVRNFSGNSNISSIVACDKKTDRLKNIKEKFPAVTCTPNFEDLLHPDIDAVVIATQVDTHYTFAKKALEAGKHIWIEKPFTANSTQAKELIELSEKKGLNIFVDHTFIYTGAVRKIKEIIDRGELGEVIYFDSVRINLGLFQHDINVIWDLAPHDLSIMDYIISKKKITGVCANGIANYYNYENIAYLSVYFEDNCFAHFHLNWTSPVKIRRMIVGGKKKMLVFDDMENSEKIKVYNSGVEVEGEEGIYNALVQYRIGDMYSPKVSQTEALTLAVAEFIDSIIKKRIPLTNAYDGLKIVQILEAGEESIKQKGKFIEIHG